MQHRVVLLLYTSSSSSPGQWEHFVLEAVEASLWTCLQQEACGAQLIVASSCVMLVPFVATGWAARTQQLALPQATCDGVCNSSLCWIGRLADGLGPGACVQCVCSCGLCAMGHLQQCLLGVAAVCEQLQRCKLWTQQGLTVYYMFFL